MIKLNRESLRAFSLGSSFLSTGGGGSPYLGELIAEQTLLAGHELQLASLNELNDDALVVCIGGMGAPEISYEKIPSLQEGILAFEKMQDFLGRKIDALIPMELAGFNGILPFSIAASVGIPVVDADGMGRAFPKIDMTTFNAFGDFGSPTVLANEQGETLILENVRNMSTVETYARAITIKMGGVVFFASYVMTVETAKSVAIPSTMSLTLALGEKMLAARKNQSSLLVAACDLLQKSFYGRAEALFSGKIIDCTRSSKTGFTVGKAIIESLDGQAAHADLYFQNEYYLVTQKGAPLIMTPDLICVIDHDSHEPISTESLRYGQRITIVGVRAPEILKREAALNILGPKSFGLDLEYQPF